MKKFAFVGMVLLVIGILGTAFHWHEIVNQNSVETVQENIAIDNDQINTIDIDGDIVQVNFYQTTEDMIQVDFSGQNFSNRNDLLTVNETDDTLLITLKHKSRFFNLSFLSSWFNRNQVLTIGIPESFTGSIDSTVSVGSVQLNDLSLDQLTVLVDVGGIEGSNLDVNQARVKADVGEVDLADVTGEWYLETDIGDINLLHLDWQGKLEAHTSIGDIMIRIAEEPDYYSMRLDADLGNVKGAQYSYIDSRSEADLPRLEATSEIGDITVQWLVEN